MELVVFDALRALINRARFLGRGSLAVAREETIAAGFTAEVVDEAIRF